MMFAKYFEYYNIILGGRFFVDFASDDPVYSALCKSNSKQVK